MRKYELIDDRHYHLRRIRAVRDIPEIGVREGDIGGWVESERNLSHEGTCWVGDRAVVSSNAIVSGDAIVSGNALVADNARVNGDARVTGKAIVSRNARVTGNARVSDSAQVTDDVMVYGDALVSGGAVVSGHASVPSDARVSEPSHVLTATVLASDAFMATLFRTYYGHKLLVGCWRGTVPEFRSMVEGDDWPEAGKATRDLRRPELLAFADMCDARIKTWKE